MGIIGGFLGISLLLLNSLSGGLHTPESVQCYKEKLYISNVGNLPPDAKDGDGYISLANLKGRIIKEKFISGLNAPKGITFSKGKLFVTDIDRVIVADPNTGRVLKTIPVPGSKFLNDAGTDGRRVYVTDTLTNTIYVINPANYSVSVFLQDNRLQGPNGIAFTRNGKLIVVSYGSGKVFEILPNKTIKEVAKVNGFLDGVVVLEDGTVIFSDFSGGRIFALKNGKLRQIKGGLITPADLGYCNGYLYVPEFSGNSVKILKVKR